MADHRQVNARPRQHLVDDPTDEGNLDDRRFVPASGAHPLPDHGCQHHRLVRQVVLPRQERRLALKQQQVAVAVAAVRAQRLQHRRKAG